MRGYEIADDFRPGVDYFGFAQALAEPEPLHQSRHQLGWGLPSVGLQFFLGQTAPFSEYGGAKRRVH